MRVEINGVYHEISNPDREIEPINFTVGSRADLYKFAWDAGRAVGLKEAQPKWISVEERLPEIHGQKCVGLYSQHGHEKPYPFPFVFTWCAYGDNGYVNGPHFSDEGLDGLKVHYWMPLPEPPKEDV